MIAGSMCSDSALSAHDLAATLLQMLKCERIGWLAWKPSWNHERGLTGKQEGERDSK